MSDDTNTVVTELWSSGKINANTAACVSGLFGAYNYAEAYVKWRQQGIKRLPAFSMWMAGVSLAACMGGATFYAATRLLLPPGSVNKEYTLLSYTWNNKLHRFGVEWKVDDAATANNNKKRDK
jgi:hypothetical protein